MKKKAVVVGSGAGGAVVARGLVESGHDVTIVEWGKDNPPKGGFLSDPFRYFGGMKNKSNGILKSINEPYMDIVRGITTGGGTLMYGGVSWDPDYDLFDTFDIDLRDSVEDIKNEITISPLKDDQMGPAAKMINKSALEMGFGWEKIDRLFESPDKFKQTSYLFGDKTGARWDARSWIFDAVNKGGTLFNETFCEEVIVENGKASGVIVTDKKGTTKKIVADVVIIAAGGIGSPRILKKADIHNAGEKIFVDPYTVVTGYVDKVLAKTEVTRQAGVLLEEDGISMGDSCLPVQAYNKLVMANKKMSKIFKKDRALSILVEIDDELSGHVDSDYKIMKPLSSEDLKKLEKGKNMAKEILHNAGAKDIWFSSVAGVHPGGGCKIGKIVNSNLEAELKNLFVCDASILPKGSATPPVLTILALGKRLTDHINTI